MNFMNLADNVFLVELPAELIDPDEKPILNATVPQKTGQKGSLLLDCGAVKFMNGMGAYQLVKLDVLARQRGQRLLAVGVLALLLTPAARVVMLIYGFYKLRESSMALSAFAVLTLLLLAFILGYRESCSLCFSCRGPPAFLPRSLRYRAVRPKTLRPGRRRPA